MPASQWFSRYDRTATTPENRLEQGLILPDFKYFNPRLIKDPSIFQDNSGSIKVPFLKKDVIILTQSCDLQKNSLKHVHVCPILTLDEIEQQAEQSGQFDENFTREMHFEQLRTGARHSRYLINKCSLVSFPQFYGKFLVVCLDLAVVVSPELIKNYIKNRNSPYYPLLNPPYREAMAQSYGRYFMRVGNPVDYDKYTNS